MIVNTDCYLAVLTKYRKKFFDAHFEVITQTANSCLSPSKELLHYAKENEISFEDYEIFFINEISENPEAKKRINEIREIAKDKVVFLVCYERDPEVCHRSIVKKIIERVIKL